MKNEDRSARTRAKILEASAESFAEKGFFKCSMQEIAESAGVSKGAVYGHFASKEELFRETLLLVWEAGARKAMEEADRPPYLESLIAMLSKCFRVPDFPFDHRFWVEALALSFRDEKIRATFINSELSARSVLRSLLARGVADGELDPEMDVEGMAILLLSLCDGLMARIAFEPRLNFGSHLDQLERALRRALTSDRDAPRAAPKESVDRE